MPNGSVYMAFGQGFSRVVAISRDGGKPYSRPITIGPVTDIQDPQVEFDIVNARAGHAVVLSGPEVPPATMVKR